ncbi:hypothetical protein H5P28_16620 [Ruficoccus amylovorans]|uniref:Uncharacterized protein n=1 Tax=Ruficoccus amylovorans TaxID=1804625 RepID=A0A842HIA6_9BACT|nr:hypothetical protein [Ruficoccus amylovorans]MBC2595890.1 hypothetical protein [Ruficoccus amylovorans]
MTCPNSKKRSKDLDFQVSQVSDCCIISAETSPSGILQVVKHCSSSILGLLRLGLLCRGYITKGNIYHDGFTFFGSGYVRAYTREGDVRFNQKHICDVGTPFVEIDRSVLDYVDSCDDQCVKEMFGRMVLVTNGIGAVYPFKLLKINMPLINASKMHKSIMRMRTILDEFKAKLPNAEEDDRVRIKIEHYMDALDVQLQACDKADQLINNLDATFPHH